MKAVILVGGEGTRLRPLTCKTPKGMVPVLNHPFLEMMFRQLSRFGVKEIILAESRTNQVINDYFGDGHKFGIDLRYQVEPEPRGTAGGIKNAAEFLTDGPFLVLNGDTFHDLDIGAMIESHYKNKARATIALTPVEDPTAYGLIETNRNHRVTRFVEKPDKSQITTNNINAGTYILEPEILDLIPSDKNYSIERQVYPYLLENGERVFAFPSSGYWIDIGTPQKYLRFNFDMLKNETKAVSPIAGQGMVSPEARTIGPVLVGDDCVVEAGAEITGPVVIGHGSRIASGAVVKNSVIWQNVEIGEGAEVTDSAIAGGCKFYSGVRVKGAVLGDNVVLGKDYQLPPGMRVWPDTNIT